MNLEVRKYLADIHGAIQNVDVHLSGKRDYMAYSKNLTVKRAVEREMEIIGEAIGKILKIVPNISITKSKAIIGMRNRIIHSYDSVDDNLIWKVIIVDLPVLKEEVSLLLGDAGEEK